MNKVFFYFTTIFLLMFYMQAFPQENSRYETNASLFEQLSIFIEWPSDSINKDLNHFFIIGLLDNNPFYPAVEAMYKDKQIKGKKVIIKHITKVEDIGNIHLLFIPLSEKKNLAKIIKNLKYKPILLFSDIERFCEEGGHVAIYKNPTDYLFAINDQAIKQSGLDVSTPLLSCVKIVREK